MLSLLRDRQPRAALAIEVAAQLGPAGLVDLDASLAQLEMERAVVVEYHAAPDVHLEGCDLRVIALVPHSEPAAQAERAAHAAAETVWDDWLRQFLATHRCT